MQQARERARSVHRPAERQVGRGAVGRDDELRYVRLGLGERADALIEQFRIGHVAHRKAGELSYGQQKLVDIAMAFMSEPDLVLLDEPCAGVNPSLVGGISALLKDLNRSRKSSFVVIEHNMDFVMDLCHRILVMVEGKVMAVGTPAEIRANKQVLDAYLGS